MRFSLSVTIASVLFVSSVNVHADPAPIDAQPQRVSMFKNGLALVTSRAEVDGAGTYQTLAPQARYGSLWIGWEPGLSLTNIVLSEVDQPGDEREAVNLIDLLRANVGSKLSLQLHDEDAWLTGTLVSMPTRTTQPPSPVHRGGYVPPIYPHQSNLLILRTEQGTEAIPPTSVTRVRFPDGAKTNLRDESKMTALRFEAGKPEGDGNAVHLKYLAQGIAWSPSYAVEMVDDETARIVGKAVIVNDLMDLDAVDVELIAGYPNIRFADSPSPMSTTPLARLLNGLRQQGRQQNPYGVMANAAVMQQRDAVHGGSASESFGNIPAMQTAGESAEDLYFYQVPDVTLAKGERGYFPLLTAEVPGKHVYTWEIADRVDGYDRYREPSEEAQQVVWHSLELTNTTDQPWTTAPGMTVKDGRVLGQDMLTYTPPKGTSQLNITQAVSIDAQQNETEVARERNAVSFHGSTYDKVTVEGTLSITNYKDKPVTIEATKFVSGEVESADLDPEIVKVASGLNRVNPRSKITWETKIEPGKDNTVTVMYRYSFYTR